MHSKILRLSALMKTRRFFFQFFFSKKLIRSFLKMLIDHLSRQHYFEKIQKSKFQIDLKVSIYRISFRFSNEKLEIFNCFFNSKSIQYMVQL